MIIQSYGLFWRTDKIEWNPGQGNRGRFRLLGRRGANLPGLQIADFMDQRGIYILYGNLGPYYVGLVRRQPLGKRLKVHLNDGHEGNWDRFSWFGFRKVLRSQDENGFRKLNAVKTNRSVNYFKVIGDIEALLIKAMALRNIANMRFTNADEWTQIKLDEIEKYTRRLP